MAKLTDRQKKQIIAEYAENKGQVSYASLDKKYGVSETTIRRVSKADPQMVEMVGQIKSDNTRHRHKGKPNQYAQRC